MSRLPGSGVLRLVIAPTAVAAFAAFELWHKGALAAVGVAWLVFVLCVFSIATWGRLQLAQTERRLRSLRTQRPRKTR